MRVRTRRRRERWLLSNGCTAVESDCNTKASVREYSRRERRERERDLSVRQRPEYYLSIEQTSTMKFRQRQILLTVGIFCFGVFFFLHSRTPDNRDQLVEANQRDARAFFPPRADGDVPSQMNQQAAVRDNADSSVKNTVDKDAEDRQSPAPVVYVNQTAESECPNLLRPENVEETHMFQKVDGRSAILEFSAFLDVEQGVVRVVGLSVLRTGSVVCLLWYHPHQLDPELRVVQGKLSTLPEHHGRRYSAHYIECPLPKAANHPYAVSVTSQDCRSVRGDVTRRPANVIPVLKAPASLRRNFTVCITPLNYRYSRAYELVEMIELNRMLGADLFTFYVNSVGENVQKVLRWYEARGVVQLVDWKLPMFVDHWPPAQKQPEVHYFAQLASHNDCLNRHRGVSRYLVYQDLDEFIIPKRTSTWAQLLSSLKANKPSGYIFRCVFFRKDWTPNKENFTGRATADRLRSIVLATDKREPNFFSFVHRAKYIVDPSGVQTVGIHNVWKFRNSGRMVSVGEQNALLHHYRSWENPNDEGRAVRDTDMYRFKDLLLQRLEKVWSELPQVPLDIPLSHYGQV